MTEKEEKASNSMGPIGYLWTTTTSATKRKSLRIDGNMKEIYYGRVPISPMTSPPPPPPPQFTVIPSPDDPMEFLSRPLWYSPSSELSKSSSTRSIDNWSNVDVGDLVAAVNAQAPTVSHHHYHGSNGNVTTVEPGWLSWIKNGKKYSSKKKKEKARVSKAEVHATLSVAKVAAAMAVMTSGWPNCHSCPNQLMHNAMASASELLASHFVDIAKQTGANYHNVVSTVQSAVEIKSAGDLITLTAAAATSLRAMAVLKRRLMERNGARYAVVVPCGNIPDFFCKEGSLRKRTSRGGLRWKHVTIYINKNSQDFIFVGSDFSLSILEVVIKLKDKHIAAVFLKNKIYVVYATCEIILGKGKIEEKGLSFGLNTSHGIMEFVCENEIQRQNWVDGVRNLLHQVSSARGNELDKSLQKLKVN